MSYQKYNRLFLLISIMIVLFVAISLNNILASSISPNNAEYNNNMPSLCRISIITCLNNTPFIPQEHSDMKKQTDLIIEQLNSTKLNWILT